MELAVDYRFCIINLKRKNMKKEKEKKSLFAHSWIDTPL